MLSQTLQYLFSGLTNGAIYALAALGFSIIYNASGVINFAQGEFIMIGGVSAVMLTSAGVPMPLAIVLAVLITALVGLLLEKLAIEPAGNAEVVSLVIITIGGSSKPSISVPTSSFMDRFSGPRMVVMPWAFAHPSAACRSAYERCRRPSRVNATAASTTPTKQDATGRGIGLAPG